MPACVDPDNDDSDFSLSSSTRSDLSSILVVHPIATFLTLICFIMAATSHLHSPSHSPRYLLGLMILSIPTLLITLLAFLVDILLFIPHLAWGGWIVLAATILILASGIVTCAMRRTLVSRKARKKRIAENAEMNGENFYARQAAPPAMPVDRAESPPPLTKEPAMSDSDKLPAFATFETKNGADDDRIPLNTRTPSNKTLPSMPSSGGPTYSDDGNSRYGVPGRGGPGGIRGGRGERYDGPSDQDGNPMNNGFYDGPRDEYGNVLPSSNAFGPPPSAGMRRDQSEPPMMRRQYSDETMNSQSSRGRGRGGYPSRGYGRGVPYGPGRGGYVRGGIPTGVMAAGAGAGIVAGDRRRGLEPHPPGYGNGYPPQGRPGQYNAPGPGGYGRSPSAPGYGRHPSSGTPSAPGAFDRQSPGPPSAPGGYANGAIAYGRRPSGENPGSYGSGPSPAGPPLHPGGYGYAMSGPKSGPQQYRNEPSPPLPLQHPGGGEIIGQAIEMDARTGSPGTASPSFARPMLLRDSDSDVQGFVDLQQQSKGKAHRDSPASLTSVYSANE